VEVASLPNDEAERLAALRRYEVLDTEAEPEFDDLARFASELCGTPIALVSLVDADRQWFKARTGLDVAETPRSLAFCAHAILQHDFFEVPDASTDPRFADNPLVAADPKIRFYASAPLVDPEGHALGTLCVIDRVPRHLDALQRQGLRVLGQQVIAQLELRRRLRELAAQQSELARARDAALAAVRAKDVFLANMGHELRTPLNAILGCAELLREDADRPECAHLMPDLHTIDRSGRHLLAVIEDILDLARLEAGVPQIRSDLILLTAVLDELHSALRPQLRGKAFSLRVDAPADLGAMQTDATKLRQILLNLLSNAIKFTAQGSIDLSVRRAREDGRDLVVFEVADTGIGIAPDKLPLLFRDFSQVHDRRQNFGGTGLGLAISRRYARLLGGDIIVSSEPGRGSRFTLKLPG
jgi:signal transduction histidine kinase